jgi:excinuclease ABC subunit C
MKLKDKLALLPEKSGIYQYFDESGKLLYIGKAKNLKNRVKSYFRFTPILRYGKNLSPRIQKMISETYDLEYIIVDSEHDALILENSLIKQLHPKYNILLRDDKTYPYIYVDLNEDFPRFEITRRVIKGKNIKYFGPFSTSSKEIIDSLYDLFQLVQKRGSLKNKKACLFYQINRCPAPCEGKISTQEYKKIVLEAMEYINDKKKLLKLLEEKMFFYSEKLLFEDAKIIHDRIQKIQRSTILSNIDLAKIEDYDIFAVEIEEKIACGMRIFIREGKVVSSSNTIFKSDNGFDKDELYRRILLEYYKNDLLLVKSILVNEDFDELQNIQSILSKQFNKNVKIINPIKGEKKRLTTLALSNAKEILRLQNKDKSNEILQEIKSLFELQRTPYVIEAYDNSHLQGSATVGAMIKWENGKFNKKDYRQYNLDAKDEYAQMRETLTRRFESFHKNPPPDLIILDGGDTLLKLAHKLIKKYGAFVDIISIAKEKRDFKANRSKGKANDIIYTKESIFRLNSNDRRLHFVQRMRDESHRFVLAFHRKQRQKADKEISLLKQRGVGEATLKKLIQYFETFENIEKASFEEVERVVGTKVAESIKKI